MAAAAKHVQLVDVEDRAYQLEIAQACTGRNSLIVLPTGLGKTLICARVMARHLERGQRVLVLAPTRPLVEQHARTFREHLDGVDVTVVTGRTDRDGRGQAWTSAPVVVATPQVARNDLVAGKLDAGSWGLLVVDEAHRAVGHYAAVEVAEHLSGAGARVLGATASPGAEAERIQEVCTNLAIQHIEARGPWDADVRPYVETVRTDWVRVTLPNTLEQAAASLRKLAEAEAKELRRLGLYSSRFTSRRELLKVKRTLSKRLQGNADATTSRALGHVGRGLRALHGVQLIQTQSVAAARGYLERMADEDAHMAATQHLQDARRLLDRYMGEHPKMRRCASELRDHLANDPEGRAIVFTQFRATAQRLVKALSQVHGVDPALFVGQGGKDGMTQQAQVDLLDRFRDGTPNVLVATSVGEEGLDVPSVGLVIFYEPVSNPIRSIQRRGRTGRQEKGRVVLLMARGTSDEAAYWSSTNRERKMRQLVQHLREHQPDQQRTLIRPNPAPSPQDDDQADGPRVLVDHRELNGPLARLLRQAGIRLSPETLPVGDVVVSNRLVIERKEARDFARSILDGRLMEQARALKRNFEAPVFVVEGDPFQAAGGIRREAIAGALSALASRFGITVLTVADLQQAAATVTAMINKEHQEDTGPPQLRHGSCGRRPDEQQRYLMEGLPHVSAKLATRLLDHFGSPAEVFAASQDELRKVKGIGPTTARAIHEVLHQPFEAPWRNGGSTSTRAQAPTTASGTGAERSGS